MHKLSLSLQAWGYELHTNQPQHSNSKWKSPKNCGENPTVKIVWGTQDRGIQPIPDFSWDNEVTISTNQSSGTFSTNITIPAQGNVYYFRAIASNAAGTVVSRNLGFYYPLKLLDRKIWSDGGPLTMVIPTTLQEMDTMET